MKITYLEKIRKLNLEEFVGEGLLIMTDSTGVSGPSSSSSSTGMPFIGFSLLMQYFKEKLCL